MIKLISSVFLLIGAMVGGGILAIPIVSAKFGFYLTFVFIIASWLIMTKTGLYILSLSLTLPEKNNTYFSIVGRCLGTQAQVFTIILFLGLLYFSLASYVSGCVSIILSFAIVSPTKLSYALGCGLFVAVFGSLVMISNKLIVKLNTILVAVKLSLLFIIIFAALDLSPLSSSITTINPLAMSSLFIIIINAFGFHYIIPSLVTFHGKTNPERLKTLLVLSTSIVFLLYTTWLFVIYCIIPTTGEHGLLAIYQSQNQLLAFNQSLAFYLASPIITKMILLFQSVALFGSFYCIALAIFDFLVDIFKSDSRFVIGLITFIPPLILVLFSENMYVYAMSLAGYVAIILEVIIPTLAIKSLAKPWSS